MIKKVVFDLDGMIVSGEIFSKRLEKEYGIPTSITREFFEGTFKECQLGKKDLYAELAKRLKEWKWRGTVDEMLDFWFNGNVVDERFFPVIHRLRKNGVKCVLATNQDKRRAEYYKKKLEGIFDREFHSYEIGALKPTKEFLDAMMKELEFKKEEVLFWDDKPEFVQAASEYGLRAKLYTNFESFKKTLRRLNLVIG